MPHFLLDTNICIYIRQNRPEDVRTKFETLSAGEAAISVITWGELQYGAHKSKKRELALERLERFAGLVPVLPLPSTAGLAYGRVRAALETAGTVIGNNDLWIAAHALTADLTLVTNNEREFRRIKGLRIENWAA